MARRNSIRGVKICPHCGGGYDGFKSREVRGRYCSLQCMTASRARRIQSPLSAPLAVGPDIMLGVPPSGPSGVLGDTLASDVA